MSSESASEPYRRIVRELSDRVVEAQRPIRILDAIKWDASVQEAFFASGGAEQPPVDRAYYEARPLPFDPEAKKQQFQEIERDVARRLGQFSPVGAILRRTCREYLDVVRMLDARGTPEFSRIAKELYGGPTDAFHAGDLTIEDLGTLLSDTLGNAERSDLLKPEPRAIPGDEAVQILQTRLDAAFPDPQRPLRVLLSDGIVSDAAAGSDYLKIRREAVFNERDLRLLEIHEGWVHLGTTISGLSQPVCTFLGKGPPSATITQEGLAIFMELITFSSHAERLRRLSDRIHGVRMADEGATFRDVYRFFRERGLGEGASFNNAARVFRGSTPEGGPFTKDLSYSKGFILVYNFIMLAVHKGLLDRIRLLFAGKTVLEDMRTLAALVEEGLVEPPKHLPPQVADLQALTAWMGYSNFLNRLDMKRIEADYAGIL